MWLIGIGSFQKLICALDMKVYVTEDKISNLIYLLSWPNPLEQDAYGHNFLSTAKALSG